MAQNKFDLIVIGSGPGGQRGAVQAAKLGKTVAIIERDRLGGYCLHKGTIPSKSLRESALSDDPRNEARFQKSMARTREVIVSEQSVIENQLTRNKITCFSGTASFIDPHTIQVKNSSGQTTRVSADYIIIATGTRPHRPEEIPFDETTILDSDTILGLAQLPKTLAVVGAGVIGCEYASIFSRLGTRVSLFDQRSNILRSVDGEILQSLTDRFAKSGIELRLGKKIGRLSKIGSSAELEFGDEVLKFDCVLYCLGRCGNVEELSLKNAGLEANNRGLISVNECYQTPIPHIYAVGDIQGAPALATSAAEQGRMAAASAFQHYCGVFPETFPYGIYTIPEISQVGPTEEEVKAQNRPYVVGRARYKELARGKILDDNEGLLKLIFDAKSERLLGVHIIGSGATELVHIGQTALALGAKVDFFVTNVFNYPTLAEAYKVAGYAAFNFLQNQKRVSTPTSHPV